MPKNKDAYSRYRIIDQVLRRRSYIKTSELAEICSEKMGIPVAQRTIQKDLSDLRFDTALNINAPIKEDKSRKAYYYPENVDEIFPTLELQKDEITALLFYANTLKQYKNFGIFENFSSAIEKIVDAVSIKASQFTVTSKIIVQPENLPKFKGSELIPYIIEAFDKKKKIQFTYKKYSADEPKEHVVTPYLLKEFDHLWYLLGQINDKDFITTFALDRISDFKISDIEFSQTLDFDPEMYFKHAFGIAVPNDPVEEVILEFDAWRSKYLKAAPIHSTQEIISESKDRIKIKLRVIPFHELYAKILSYGKHVKVISPENVKDEIKLRLQEAFDQY